MKLIKLITYLNTRTCSQSNHPMVIDLILFKQPNTFETGLSGHHKLVSAILKSGSLKKRFIGNTENLTFTILKIS